MSLDAQPVTHHRLTALSANAPYCSKPRGPMLSGAMLSGAMLSGPMLSGPGGHVAQRAHPPTFLDSVRGLLICKGSYWVMPRKMEGPLFHAVPGRKSPFR